MFYFPVYLSCAEKVDNATVKIQLLSSGRLMLKGILTKIKASCFHIYLESILTANPFDSSV